MNYDYIMNIKYAMRMLQQQINWRKVEACDHLP